MFAYLDAATGSMVVSAVAAGAAGFAVAGRSMWTKMKSPFAKTEPESALDTDETVDESLEID